MKVTLLITQPPASPVAGYAIDFAAALLRQQHTITRVFLFAEGVCNARKEAPLAARWQALMRQYQLDVTVCSGSAHQYGVTDTNSLLPIGGMADWLMATLDSDRLMTF